MAQHVGRGLRPARRSGLTSPDRSAPRWPATASRPLTPAQEPGQAAGRASGKTSTPQINLRKLTVQESRRKRPTKIGRWIEA
jgi:hypothetical protein